MYFEAESVDGVYSDYLVDDVSLVMYNPPADIIQTGKGWKDVRSTMRVGGCVTCGSKTYFNNEGAKAQVLKDANTVNVQAYPAWGRWDETKRHVYHLDEFSAQVKEMKAQGMSVTMHMLLGWDQYFPQWFRENDFHPDTLDAIMKSWLTAIITQDGNDTLVDVWNVVNEAITWDGKGGYWPLFNDNYSHACEFQRMGFEPDASGLTGDKKVHDEHPVYIRKAFEYARTLTDAKLELRDAGFEFPGSSKYDAFYQLAVHLKKVGAPVDIVGFQSHIDVDKNYNWDAYTNNIRRYVDLGYEVHIPEVDVGDAAQNWSDEKAARQKRQYYQLVTAAIKGGATDFQTWGFIDNPNNYWRAGENGLPYTYHFEPKPAYYGIMEALVDMSSVLYWEMGEMKADTMPDVLSYNNFGVAVNIDEQVFTEGFSGNALQFDGENDYLNTILTTEKITGDFTLQFFIKTIAETEAVVASLIADDASKIEIGINSAGEIFAAGESIAGSIRASEKAINDDQWHFVALQRDSAGYHLFVDDLQPVASSTGTTPIIDKLIVGADNANEKPFRGAIDEVKLFDTAVETESFRRHYAPLPPEQLSYTSNNDMSIRLTWADPADNEAGFVIERKEGDGEWVEIGSAGTNKFIFDDEPEKYETEYSYRVRSFTSAGKSYPSNVVTYTTPSDPATNAAILGDNNNWKIYPNPVNEKLVIKTEPYVSIRLTDVNGRVLLQKDNFAGHETFDVSGLPNGLFIVHIKTKTETTAVKLVKN